ncbi:peptidylprolyl isomerase [Siccirubricoccus sp. KC 17139]|uniref:Peptidyl-prolyl cis-trans isomerase n=1 Tax=Siccirubricoccus soli TaxID=2899147 RepID=A0ABT1CYB1_9PROT|nr:peptidylprolyl isomerase [Siccirubricoccus soli]MCO6414656.1 peptidylprolyl isomerase [Siccirubricoccus soli]MCP2680786.1 peptidylprolyl isomerase [Siccirubricoccus soli]
MRRRELAALAAAAALPALPGRAQQTQAPAGEERLVFELKDGPVTIQFLPDVAPRHVERIKLLVGRGFYDGTPFHRVIEGFMAQGGDPTGTGTGGARDLPDLPAEFTNKYRFTRGICGMARSSEPNSANSQFFIMFGPSPSLDGKYTIWGRGVAGMEAVDKIKRGDPPNGIVRGPDRLLRARLVAA